MPSDEPQTHFSIVKKSNLDELVPNVQLTGGSAIEAAAPQFGTPERDSVFWQGQQGYSDTCAIRCQEFILEQYTGHVIAERDLVQQAIDHGWYTPGGGTPLQNIGSLLELNGISVHRYHNASVFHLANELAQGHKVIVGVDSGDLWRQHPILHAIEGKLGIAGADHAVVVSGIDTSNPEAVRVIVSDPGTGQQAASYPLDQFIAAWKGSAFFMVATRDPAPHWLNEMVNFDYAQGHINQVWGMPYDKFLGLADYPESWNERLAHSGESDNDFTIPELPRAELTADFDAIYPWPHTHLSISDHSLTSMDDDGVDAFTLHDDGDV